MHTVNLILSLLVLLQSKNEIYMESNGVWLQTDATTFKPTPCNSLKMLRIILANIWDDTEP